MLVNVNYLFRPRDNYLVRSTGVIVAGQVLIAVA
ncbi:hypothetical protein P3T25_009783, partial [Paraburkholderia sp. GAS32]